MTAYACPACGQQMLGLDESCSGSFLDRGHPANVRAAATMELHELTASARDTDELIEWNRALRDHLARQDPQDPATTEINGGDLVIIVDEEGLEQSAAQVLSEIDAFLDYYEAVCSAEQKWDAAR